MSVTRSEVGGYEAFTVAGGRLRATCLPGRGAHLTSLLAGGHEWLWAPPGGPRLAPVGSDSDFKPHREGCDDCFPTITEDVVLGVHYEDHGLVWHRPWRVLSAVERLHLAIDLPTCGLTCERIIAPDGDGLRLEWRIRNRAAHAVPYLWSWHPLFAWHPGDRLELPGAALVRLRLHRRREDLSWPDPAPGYDLSAGEIGSDTALKGFVPDRASAILRSGGSSLTMRWDPLVLPWTGVYINRLPGEEQWALEPTNVCADRLSRMAAVPPTARLPAHGERCWTIRLQPGRT